MEIRHPLLALCIVFGIASVLSTYGVLEGTLMVISLLVGILIYRAITR